MTNVRFGDISQYRDIEIKNMYQERIKAGYSREEVMESIYVRGRDNARTPMQWSGEKNAGFTEGEPWIEVNPNYVKINAEEEQKNPDSIFHYYQKLIQLRKQEDVLVDGRFVLLFGEDEQIFAYTRTNDRVKLLVCANFTGMPAKCSLPQEWRDAEVLIHNYAEMSESAGKSKERIWRPYEAVMLRKQM